MKIYVVIFKDFIIIILYITKQALHLKKHKMKPTLVFKMDNKNVKKPVNLKNGVFLIYAPKKIMIEPMQFVTNDKKDTVTFLHK